MRVSFGLALALAVATPALAQFSITPGGANAGNGVFGNGTIPTTATSTGIGSGVFRPTTTASLDNLFANTWWFRGNNDTREYTFANTVTAPLNMSGVLVGNNANTLDTGGYDFTVANATSAYNFNAVLRYRIIADTFGAKVFYSAVISNTGTSALSLAVFNYNDFDANGTAGTDTYSINGAGNVFTVADGPTTLEYQANAPNAYQATAFATLRTALADAAITNLNNTVAGSPGDFTGAFQWNLNLAPGDSATVGGYMAFIPTPSSAALLGLGGLVALRRRR